MSSYAGEWQSTFGPMTLVQEGAQVRGSYLYMGSECRIEGTVQGCRLVFTYQEPTVHGAGWFELSRTGKSFAGQFHPDGIDRSEPWVGDLIGFDGLWNSSFGLLRLIETEGRVCGFYEPGGGGATIDGQCSGNRLLFKYREPKERGRGRFELAKDGLSFQGEWKVQGTDVWKPWSGIRVRPQLNQVWLVVIEAPWQRFLTDREYAFGNMLREFFARTPQVQVRHRYFSNEESLRKCCRDLLFIAEPIVLVLTTHGVPEGITVNGRTIRLETVLEDLRPIGNLQLLHFSACLLMQDPAVMTLLRDYSNELRLPISGYTSRVDWAESAIIEFTLLDLILSRGLAPVVAGEQLTRLLPFCGTTVLPETAYAPAGLTFVRPETVAPAPPVEAAPPVRRPAVRARRRS